MAGQSMHLARAAEAAFERRGDYESLLFEGRWHRSGELFDRAAAVATGLARLGLEPGERVVVTMTNCPEVGVIYQAVWRAGLVATPAMFLLPEDDLRHLLADSGARAVVTTPEFLDKVRRGGRRARARAVGALHRLGAGRGDVAGRARGGAGGGDRAARRRRPRGAALHRRHDRPGQGRDAVARGAALRRQRRHTRSRTSPGIIRSLVTLPLSHAYGLLVTVAGFHSVERDSPCCCGGSIPTCSWTRSSSIGCSRRRSFRRCCKRCWPGRWRTTTCRRCAQVTSGASPLSAETEREFTRRVPSASIRQGYGLTESAALVSSNPVGRVRAGSVGLPVPGCEVEIRDPDGRPLPAGEAGEICVRSPGLMLGYWNAPETTARRDPRRMAAHRRHRPARRGRLPVHRRPDQGPDHPRRLQRVPA